MADAVSPTRQHAARPQLAAAARSSSYLSDHQQYRPPRQPEPHYGIDTFVEDLTAKAHIKQIPSPKSFLSFNGVPSPEHPPTVIESGVSHSLSHPNCVSAAGHSTERLVATLFYKGAARHTAVARTTATTNTTNGGSKSPVRGARADSTESLPSNMAPTTDMAAFPLEPPPLESEQQLDHLYGSYISPLCITSFLHLMSAFPQSKEAPPSHSSHRCLDNQETPRVVELVLAPAPSPQYLSLSDLRKHEMIFRFEREWNVDVALQRDFVWRRYRRMVVFDMDSTLITQEVIQLMADTIKDPPDLAARIENITHRAMLGELEFEASFRERVTLLKGISATIFEELRPVLNLTRGVPELIKALKRLGVKTALLSGGFHPLTTWLARSLGIDYAYANEVAVEDGKLTGEATGTIVTDKRKRELLINIAAEEKIDLSQVIAVGDGANDLLMMEVAGLGVAWNAKPRVQMEADARLNGDTLLDLLFLFGFSAEEIDALVG